MTTSLTPATPHRDWLDFTQQKGSDMNAKNNPPLCLLGNDRRPYNGPTGKGTVIYIACLLIGAMLSLLFSLIMAAMPGPAQDLNSTDRTMPVVEVEE